MGIPKSFYDEDYFENGISTQKSGYNNYSWNDRYLQHAQDLINHFQPKKVLDIGCAKGFYIRAFRELGVEAWGIELSDYACKNADPKAQAFIYQGSISSLPLEGIGRSNFDLVLCYDILEHLDEKELKKAIENLAIYNLAEKYISIKCPFEHYDWDLDKSHINIKAVEDWIKLFIEYGYDLYEPGIPKNPWGWWDDRTLIFRKKRL